MPESPPFPVPSTPPAPKPAKSITTTTPSAPTPSAPNKPIPAGKKKKEKVEERKPIRGDVIGCFLIGISVLIVLLLMLTYGVAKAGLVDVPILSDMVYNPPVPYRVVDAEPQGWESFRNMATRRLIEEGIGESPPYTLRIHEKELTALLRGVIQEGLRSPSYETQYAQVIITRDYIEFFFRIRWRDFLQFEIMVHLLPEVDPDGTLRFAPQDAQIGDMPLPSSLMLRLVGYVMAQDVGAWKILVSDGSGIQSAELFNQEIEMKIGPLSSP